MSEYLAAYTDAEIEEQIGFWKEALSAVSLGKSYTVSGREVVRADLPEIKRTLAELARERDRRIGAETPRVMQPLIGRVL
jgi:hypothetical protein